MNEIYGKTFLIYSNGITAGTKRKYTLMFAHVHPSFINLHNFMVCV